MGILNQAESGTGGGGNASETDDEDGGETESDTDDAIDSELQGATGSQQEIGFKPMLPPTFNNPEAQIFGAKSQDFSVPDFKGLTGVQFPSEQTLLAGLRADESAGGDSESNANDVSVSASSPSMRGSESPELDPVESLPPPPTLPTASAVPGTNLPSVSGALAPPPPPTFNVHEEQAEQAILAKAAECRRVMDEMLRLSVQANEMYSSLQSMVGANRNATAHESGAHVPSHDSHPLPSAFSPRKGRSTEDDVHGGDASMVSVASSISVAHSRAFSEVDRVLCDLRKSMATLAKPVGSGAPGFPQPRAAGNHSITTSSGEDAILDKYSDRLAEMVSEKVAAKMSASMSLSSFNGSASTNIGPSK